jgi:hypothetical protein
MLEIATWNWGYFQNFPDDAEVLRLLDEGERIARATGDDVSLARLLMERAAFTNDVSHVDEIVRLVESPEAGRFADSAHRVAEVFAWNGQISRALDLYRTLFERLVPAGAVINEPEALVWYGLTAINAGNLGEAERVTERLLQEATRRSAHTRQHAYALESLVHLARGAWREVTRTASSLRQLVAGNPDTAFCLLGGAAAGYGAVAEIIAGRPYPNDLDQLVTRLVPASALIQASSVMVPKVMVGERAALGAGLQAYASGLRLVDRQRTWDACDLMPTIALTMLQRWDELGTTLARLDEFARGGGRLAEAAAAAVREEEAAARGGSRPSHRALQSLGYHGISDLLRFRPASTPERVISR